MGSIMMRGMVIDMNDVVSKFWVAKFKLVPSCWR